MLAQGELVDWRHLQPRSTRKSNGAVSLHFAAPVSHMTTECSLVVYTSDEQ
jgi:hypothetical protein